MKTRVWISILIWLICSGFNLSPDTWIGDLAKMTSRTTPRYTQIKFWDQNQNNFRGFRALFYTLPLEAENRQVDSRLHDKMIQMLSYMCQDVITLESFDNPTQKMMVEAVLRELADQWKQKGTIDPSYFFFKLPFLDVDLLILMERTKYDQFVRNDEKFLTIGMNFGVFELDYGQPLYMDRTMNAIPWFGEQTSYAKAEQAALLKVADKAGERLKKAADIINQSHKEDILALKKENRQKEKLKVEQLKDQDRDYRDFARQTDEFLKDKKDPKEVIDLLRNDVNELKKILRKSPDEQADTDRQNKKALQEIISNRLGQYQLWMEDQDRRKNDQVLTPQNETGINTPGAAVRGPQLINKPVRVEESQIPAESVTQESNPAANNTTQIPSVPLSGNVFDRKWIVPGNASATPAKEPSVTEPMSEAPAENAPTDTQSGSVESPETEYSPRYIPLNDASLQSQPVIPKDFIQKMQTKPAGIPEAASPEISGETIPSPQPASATAAIDAKSSPQQKVGPNKPYVPKKPVSNPNLVPPKKVTTKKP